MNFAVSKSMMSYKAAVSSQEFEQFHLIQRNGYKFYNIYLSGL